MRTFEVVLILVNLLALFLYATRQPQAAQRWLVGLNLAVLMIHGLFEGVRYQMIFSYLFVILLTILTVVKATFRPERKTPKGIRVTVIGLSFLALMLTAFLAYALPVFRLPRPTGQAAVGIQYFHLIDEARTDPFLDRSPQKRELMIKVYYPAQVDNTKPYSPYFHGSRELVRLLTTGYNLPAFLFDHLILVKTNSKEELGLSDEQPTYPVILFSHGAGTTLETQTAESEELASHGYIVVAIDHTYVSAGTVFPDRVVSAKDATTNFDTPEPAELITPIMAQDASFVIDQLEEMEQGKIVSIFKGRLDLGHIGAIGHSVGGAVAYHLAINDERVKAAVDLDGVVYVTPQGNPKDVTPFLMLANDRYHVQAIESRTPLMKKFEDMDALDQKITVDLYGSQQVYQDAYERARQHVIGLADVLKASGNLFTIAGSDHMKFIDVGLFIAVPQLREQIGIGGSTDPTRCLEITRVLTLAFFDQHLRGDTGKPVSALLQEYPELRQVGLK